MLNESKMSKIVKVVAVVDVAAVADADAVAVFVVMSGKKELNCEHINSVKLLPES